MNYFLTLIIVGLAGGGYYEITLNQKEIARDQQQISDLQAKLDPIKAENQKLENDNMQLAMTATQAQIQIGDLTKQLQDAQATLSAANQPAAAPAVSDSSTTVAQAVPAQSNNLGNITTLDGKSYPNCQLLKVKADGIVVNDANGITQLPFSLMPLDLQKRFDFDPHVAAALTDDQVQALEAERKAAAQVAGN